MTKNKIPKAFPTVSLKGSPSQAFLDLYIGKKAKDFSKFKTMKMATGLSKSAQLSPLVSRSV
jgi:hypothetical protein